MRSLHFNSYDRPLIIPYFFPALNFGGDANVTKVLPVPRYPAGVSAAGGSSAGAGVGMGGRVLTAQLIDVTEDFTGDVTDAGLAVGIVGDIDKYFHSGLVLEETVDVGESVILVDNGSGIDIEGGRTSIIVTAIAGTTTETGIGTIMLLMAWWQGTTI